MAAVIDLAVTDEEVELLADKASVADARRLADDDEAFDRGVWRQMAQSVGLQGLCVPEAHGGSGQGPVQAAVVFEEMGRVLYPGPFLATVALAANALLASGDERASAQLLPELAAGRSIVALAVAEDDGRWDRGRTREASARRQGDGWIVDGRKSFVVDGLAADHLIVSAHTDHGAGLFVVDPTASCVERRPLPTLDLTRRLADVALDAAPARLIGQEGGADDVIDIVADRARVALAAEAVGGMRACLDLCVEHAKTRKQFGTPIGAFQAVAHKCVEMLHRVELGASAVRYAAAAQSQGSEEAGVAGRVAAAYCGQGYHWVTSETIQVHGGLGFTWEHDAHLYYRRARSSEQLLGGYDQHVDAVADLVGL